MSKLIKDAFIMTSLEIADATKRAHYGVLLDVRLAVLTHSLRFNKANGVDSFGFICTGDKDDSGRNTYHLTQGVITSVISEYTPKEQKKVNDFIREKSSISFNAWFGLFNCPTFLKDLARINFIHAKKEDCWDYVTIDDVEGFKDTETISMSAADNIAFDAYGSEQDAFKLLIHGGVMNGYTKAQGKGDYVRADTLNCDPEILHEYMLYACSSEGINNSSTFVGYLGMDESEVTLDFWYIRECAVEVFEYFVNNNERFDRFK